MKKIGYLLFLTAILAACSGSETEEKSNSVEESFKEKISTTLWNDTSWSNVINDMTKFDELMNRPQIQNKLFANFNSEWETCPDFEIYPYSLVAKTEDYTAYLYTVAFFEKEGEDNNLCTLYLVLGTYKKNGDKIADLLINTYSANGQPLKFVYHSQIQNAKTVNQEIIEYKTKESEEEEDVIEKVSHVVWEIESNGKITKKSTKTVENKNQANLLLVIPFQDYPGDLIEEGKQAHENIRYYFMKMADGMNQNAMLEKEVIGGIGGFEAGFCPLKTDNGEVRYVISIKTGSGPMYASFDPLAIEGISADTYFQKPVAAFYVNVDLDSELELVVIQEQELNGAQGRWFNYSTMVFKVKEDRLFFVKESSDKFSALTSKDRKDSDNAVYDETSFKKQLGLLNQ